MRAHEQMLRLQNTIREQAQQMESLKQDAKRLLKAKHQTAASQEQTEREAGQQQRGAEGPLELSSRIASETDLRSLERRANIMTKKNSKHEKVMRLQKQMFDKHAQKLNMRIVQLEQIIKEKD